MDTLALSIPAMYGDHHVIEVRRILMDLPGVKQVAASSAFHHATITYDPDQIDQTAIIQALDTAGYLQELHMPLETGLAAYGRSGNGVFFRHTVAYQQTRRTVGFAQHTERVGRPLWPCPGIGPVHKPDESE